MNDINQLITTVFSELLDEFNLEPSGTGDETVVFGPGGITSLQLVRLIVELEDQILEKYQKQIVLTDDKVLSLHQSPFGTIGRLKTFVQQKLTEV